MTRNYPDWLTAYCNYASFSEAPRRMHFWAGVSAIAGALRRKTWIDMGYFNWYPNFYIVFVAPPGIVSKSTTAGIAMKILKDVPGIKFGPDVVTWQALVGSFAESREDFPMADAKVPGMQIFMPMCALTLESSEFGNLLNPQDNEMVDLLVSLWDGKEGKFEKKTKSSGNDIIINPWINLIACTTPAWIAGNFPEYMIGGGFTSRCIFVFADEKDKYVAYPGRHVPKDFETQRAALTQDLEMISNTFCGPFGISEEAYKWGEVWYDAHYKNRPPGLDDDRFGGYIARKQTHIHKLAMVLSASRSDSQIIQPDDLALANAMVSDLEKDMPKVFDRIGRSETSVHAGSITSWLAPQPEQTVPYMELYKKFFHYFPTGREFGEIFGGLVSSGQIQQYGIGSDSRVTLIK